MHLLGICVLLVFLLFTNLASDFSRSDDYYYDYYYEQERTDEPVRVSTSARSSELRASRRGIGSVRRTSNHWDHFGALFIRNEFLKMTLKRLLRPGGEREDLWRREHHVTRFSKSAAQL